MKLEEGWISDKRQDEDKFNNPLAEYKILKVLGQGSYGKVYKVKNYISGEILALKKIPKKHSREQNSNKADIRVYREANITLLLQHPNIVNLKTFRSDSFNFFLFFENVNGKPLAQVIGKNGLSKSKVIKYFKQMVDALAYCHQRSIVHRDLKIENIMVSDTGQIKIIDFGLANYFDNKEYLKTSCGTIPYISPEILKGAFYVGPEVDIWSLGVILYTMVTGYLPFGDPREKSNYYNILKSHVKYPKNMLPECRNLIQQCLNPLPQNRITAIGILGHEYLKEYLKNDPCYTYYLGSPKENSDYWLSIPKDINTVTVKKLSNCFLLKKEQIKTMLEMEYQIGVNSLINEKYSICRACPLVSVAHLLDQYKEEEEVETEIQFNVEHVRRVPFTKHYLFNRKYIFKLNIQQLISRVVNLLDEMNVVYLHSTNNKNPGLIIEYLPSVQIDSTLSTTFFLKFFVLCNIWNQPSKSAYLLEVLQGDDTKLIDFNNFIYNGLK